jgi:hypothetical protein
MPQKPPKAMNPSRQPLRIRSGVSTPLRTATNTQIRMRQQYNDHETRRQLTHPYITQCCIRKPFSPFISKGTGSESFNMCNNDITQDHTSTATLACAQSLYSHTHKFGDNPSHVLEYTMPHMDKLTATATRARSLC